MSFIPPGDQSFVYYIGGTTKLNFQHFIAPITAYASAYSCEQGTLTYYLYEDGNPAVDIVTAHPTLMSISGNYLIISTTNTGYS